MAGNRLGPGQARVAPAQHFGHALAVAVDLFAGNVLAQGLPQATDGAAVCGDRIEHGGALAPILHHSGIAQLAQMSRHAALRQPGDVGEFGHAEFLSLQQQEQALACRIGQNAADCGAFGDVHAHAGMLPTQKTAVCHTHERYRTRP